MGNLRNDLNDVARSELTKQRRHWNNIYLDDPEFFGEEPSYSAKKVAKLFKREGKLKILELGSGHGRDSLFFAQMGFQVYTIDYCEDGVKTINKKAEKLGLSHSVKAICHDLRTSLPFSDESFDGIYSHMLFCMAFTSKELEFLSREAKRVLKPNGINVYTVRNTQDKHYGAGVHRGEDMYENSGFIVHFFSRNKINHLSKGYEIEGIEDFEEGELPRKLSMVILRTQ